MTPHVTLQHTVAGYLSVEPIPLPLVTYPPCEGGNKDTKGKEKEEEYPQEEEGGMFMGVRHIWVEGGSRRDGAKINPASFGAILLFDRSILHGRGSHTNSNTGCVRWRMKEHKLKELVLHSWVRLGSFGHI